MLGGSRSRLLPAERASIAPEHAACTAAEQAAAASLATLRAEWGNPSTSVTVRVVGAGFVVRARRGVQAVDFRARQFSFEHRASDVGVREARALELRAFEAS